MRRLLVIVVVFVAFALPQASANSPSPAAGEKIVYSSMRGPNVNNAEIYSIGVDGSGRRNLSRNQGNEAAFAWSPTGDRIAFTAYRSDSCGGLYLMRADGTGQECLVPPELQVLGYAEPPTWSPDGRWIAFSAYRGSYGIWVVGADGRDLRLVAAGGHAPVWAPVGNRIAFIGLVPDSHFTLEVVDADGGGRVRVANEQVISLPTWSPDGRELAYIRAQPPAGGRVLYRVDAGGGAETAVVAGGDLELANPVWSPQGRLIAFSEGQAIKAVAVDGGAPRTLASGASPAWSPNGSQIAFVSGSGVYVANADGTANRKVRDEAPARLTAGPVWSPDGTTLLFGSRRDGADYDVFVVNSDGTQMRRLTANTVDDLQPAWSPTHTRIAFVRRSSIWVMSASGTNQHRLGVGTYPSWSPDGSRIAFERYGVIYTMSDRGRRVRRVTKGSQPVWATRGARIAFLRDTKLMVANAETKAVRWLTGLRAACPYQGEGGVGATPSRPEWSPDARWLVVPVLCDYGRLLYVKTEIISARTGWRRDLEIDDVSGSVAWSPDGTQLAFSVVPDHHSYSLIATAKPDGTSITTVTSGAGNDHDPDW